MNRYGQMLINLAETQRKTNIKFLTLDFIESLGKVINTYQVDHDAFSKGQLLSKIWLVEELLIAKTNGRVIFDEAQKVFICASWYGVLVPFLLETDIPIKWIRSFDTDVKAVEISDLLNRKYVIKDWIFKPAILDILDMKYPTTFIVHRADKSECLLYEMPDIIINTSCEHIENFEKWFNEIPKGVLIILQSNNYFTESFGHINCVDSLNDFKKQAPMDYIYKGTLDLIDYDRFMLIGRRI